MYQDNSIGGGAGGAGGAMAPPTKMLGGPGPPNIFEKNVGEPIEHISALTRARDASLLEIRASAGGRDPALLSAHAIVNINRARFPGCGGRCNPFRIRCSYQTGIRR